MHLLLWIVCYYATLTPLCPVHGSGDNFAPLSPVLYIELFSCWLPQIAAYTVGYAAFALPASPASYAVGSAAFFIGSALLTYSTYTSVSTATLHLAHHSSLFWGSGAFLIGSLCFVLDAMGNLGTMSEFLVEMGYFTFVFGRARFLWGCTTNRVGFSFESNDEITSLKSQ